VAIPGSVTQSQLNKIRNWKYTYIHIQIYYILTTEQNPGLQAVSKCWQIKVLKDKKIYREYWKILIFKAVQFWSKNFVAEILVT